MTTEEKIESCTEGLAIDWRDRYSLSQNALTLAIALKAAGKLPKKIVLDAPQLAEISGETVEAVRSNDPSMLKGSW